MSDSWGLGDLTESLQGETNSIIHHVKIIRKNG